jgi:hypothetical protein
VEISSQHLTGSLRNAIAQPPAADLDSIRSIDDPAEAIAYVRDMATGRFGLRLVAAPGPRWFLKERRGAVG